MILSRAQPALQKAEAAESRESSAKTLPKLDDLLQKRDFTGALTLVEFQQNPEKSDLETLEWIGYISFHLGDYVKAYKVYKDIANKKKDTVYSVYFGCVCFFLGHYEESRKAFENIKLTDDQQKRLKNRLLFHLAHKEGDEQKLMSYHSQLQDVQEDQLSLAAIHYLRSHYQEAIDIYKRILLDNREFTALNVYIALCYYKLDYYDVSQEVLTVYLANFPNSATAVNLRACNFYRLYNGKAAEAELTKFESEASRSFTYAKEIMKHNMVVFQNGDGALQVLPPLVDVIVEARLNLVIYHLKQENVQEAYNLIKELEPTTPHEYILKGVVNAAMGQEQGSKEHLKIAQQYFQLVGGSASECDTIPGRQCMASCFFLLRQFEDVLIYLNSVKSYFYNDDTFNFNYAQAKAAVGNYKEAEELLLLIQNEKIKNDYVYLSWLARCFIMNQKPRQAWELYLKMETSNDSFSLLQLIANDCYRMGQFYYSAKAFDVLERLDPNPEYWEGKRGACVGVFQKIVAGQEPQDTLKEVLTLLRNTANPQVEYICRVIRKWGKENRVPVN